MELRKRAEFSYRTEFTDFLTLSEIETAKTVLSGSNYMFYGGHEDTERQMLCIAPEEITITPELFPICGMRIVPKHMKFAGEFSHRDVLGSVLGLGLDRDVIGDIFVSASTSETQGLTYIEAAANGLPLLCRQDDCLADVLEEGENGYEYTSAEEFLKAIDAMMDDRSWRAAAAHRSEEIAASFDKKAFGEAIENVYESVL